VGIELNPDYCKIAEARLKATYKERLEWRTATYSDNQYYKSDSYN
jgi:DNA modification methylase